MTRLLDAVKSGPAWISNMIPGKMDKAAAEKRETLELLDQSVVFRGVSRHLLSSLISQSIRINLKEGELLLAPGRQNEHVYIILSGKLNVHLTPDGDAQLIAILNPCDCVGEMSVLLNSDVSAYVTAGADSQLLAIGYSAFWNLLKSSNEAALNMLNILVKRVRAGNEAIAHAQMKDSGPA